MASGASMSERVVSCISKPPQERNNAEIEELGPWLAMKTDILRTQKPEVIQDIIRNCSYVKKVRDDVIIRQGDIGDSFYVILSGRVSIFVQTEAVADNPDDAAVVVGDENGDEMTEGKGKKELDRKVYGFCVAQFTPGRGFGELALINRNSIRNASIIADEETDLLEVNRDLFNRCLKAATEAEFQERVTFVNQCSLFNGWAGRYKRQAAMSLRKDFVEYNKPLCIQGQTTDGLIFILSGQAKIIIDSLLHFVQYPHLHLHEDPEEYDKKEMLENLLLESRPQSAIASTNTTTNTDTNNKSKLWEKPLRRQGYVFAERRQALKHIEVSLVGPGEIIGDLEQGMGFSTNSQSVICTVKSSIYHLNARNFERLINSKKNFKTLQLLKQRAEEKLMVRVERSQNKQIPLIRALVHRIQEERNQEERKEKAKEFNSGERSAFVDDSQQAGGGVFELKRGPVIDLYGPGTVFYRNRMKRIARRQAEKAKAMAIQSMTGFSSGMHNRAATSLFSMEDTVDYSPPQITHRDSSMALEDKERSRITSIVINDWETGSNHLENLEDRIRQWHTDTDRLQSSRGAPKEAVLLKRYKSEAKPRLHSGKKIVLRPRSSRSPVNPPDPGETTTAGRGKMNLSTTLDKRPPAGAADVNDNNKPSTTTTTSQLEEIQKVKTPQPIHFNFFNPSRPGTSATSREVFITAFKNSNRSAYSQTGSPLPHMHSANASSGTSNRMLPGKSSSLRVKPLSNFPEQNLQPLHRPKTASEFSVGTFQSKQTTNHSPDSVNSKSKSKFTNSTQALRMARLGIYECHHYTLEEYNSLKELLKKKRIEMRSYSMSTSS